MLLQVHDELLFEAPEDEVPRLEALAREVMESAMTLDVPLKVDIKTGADWAAGVRRFLLVGLTGSIATGKSTVSGMFAHLGARVIDADLLAREVVMPGQPAYAGIVEEFGPEVVQDDGSLDRKALGAIVFADPAKRKRLEEITHPAIGLRQQRILSVLDEEAFEGVVIWDVALLFETGGAAKMDRVVVVYADPETELGASWRATA